jgi:hypothetical protein
MTTTEALVLPIGEFYGTFYAEPEYVARYHNLRLREDILELDDARFTVWALLHGLPDLLTDRPWTRAALREAAATTGGKADPATVDGVLDALVADGLAVELAPGTDAAADFARRHRMGPRMLGLGNTAAEPWLYSIGFFNMPIVTVTHEVYDVWEAAAITDDLWTACESVATSERDGGTTDPDVVDPARFVTGLLGSIHTLLSMSVVYLEPKE